MKGRAHVMTHLNRSLCSMLISDYLERIKDSMQRGSPLRVLDMCCGKGGDLLKWQKGQITYLICTDIADISIEQCKARYEKITAHDPPERKPFRAEFFTCDSTRDRLRERYRFDFQCCIAFINIFILVTHRLN